MESQTPTNKTPLILGIISIVVIIIPFIGSLAGIVLGILAFVGGNKAIAAAKERPESAGIGVAITGKWLGLGGLIQGAISLLWTLFVLLFAAAR